MSGPSRRDVLKFACAGAFLACTGCGAAGQTSGDFAAGTVAAAPVGHLALVPSSTLILGRDAGGLYAMTSICPHQNCDMATDGTISASEVVCTCHGSRFDVNGAVKQGPAKTALEHYALTVDASGNITVHAGQVVAATVRVAV